MDVLKGHAKVCAQLAAVSPADCAISSVTACELAAGVMRCSQPERERKKLERLLAAVTILPFDGAAAVDAARFRHALETAGQKIGPYDVLIAGQAASARRRLVSNNTREFGRIPQLTLVDWRS